MLRLAAPLHLGPLVRADTRGAVDALAWTLLLSATGSRTLADDWYVDLADELIARPSSCPSCCAAGRRRLLLVLAGAWLSSGAAGRP